MGMKRVLSRHPRFGGKLPALGGGRYWGSGGCAPSGVQRQSPWSGVWGAKPPEAGSFLLHK